MNQLLQLDGIIAEGDIKLQRKNQVFNLNPAQYFWAFNKANNQFQIYTIKKSCFLFTFYTQEKNTLTIHYDTPKKLNIS